MPQYCISLSGRKKLSLNENVLRLLITCTYRYQLTSKIDQLNSIHIPVTPKEAGRLIDDAEEDGIVWTITVADVLTMSEARITDSILL